MGQIDKDVWTADSVAYTRLAVYDPYLYANVPNTGAADTRLNNKLLLPATSTLNGVQEGRYVRWDVRGRVYKIGYDANPANDFESFTYDANDRLVIADGDGQNDITRIEYENSTPEARLTRVWRANDGGGQPTVTAQETKWFYPVGETLPSSVKTHGVTYTLAYDSAKNLASVTDGLLGGVTTYGHDTRGNVTQVALVNGSNTVASQSYAFDANDRLTASTDALANVTTYGYSWQGCGCSEGDKLTSVHTPDLSPGLSWTLQYADSGRLTTILDPDNHPTSMGYTAATNRLASVTDANTHATSMDYDQLGRLSTGLDPATRRFTRAYPIPASGAWTNASVLAGSPTSTAAPTSLTATLGDGQYQIGIARYQDKGNPAQLSFYRDATFELSYGMTWDRSRRLYQRRDRNGLGITTGPALPTGFGQFDDWTNGYDLRSAGPARTNTDTTYSPFYERSTAVYNDELDVTSRVGDGQRMPNVFSDVFTRDAAGRVTQEQRKISTIMNEPSQLQGVPSKSTLPTVVTEPLLKFSYDANGRVSQWTDGDGIHDVFYDTRGLVWKITVQGGEGDFLFEYDPVGRNTKVTYPGGLIRTQVYDHEGRVTNRCYTHVSTRCYGATYDAVGNPLTLTDPDGTDTVTYDNLDRLQTIVRTGSPTQSFDYNALGALHTNGTTVLDDQRPKIGTSVYVSSAVPNTFNGTQVHLDAGGRIDIFNGMTLKYSHRGQLIGATTTNGLGAWFGHDAAGRRISRTVSQTVNNVTTFPAEEYYLWNGANVTAVVDKNATVKQSFLFEGVDQPLRLKDATGRYNYELDLAGNVRALRGATSGTVVGTYQYAGFGAEMTTSLPPSVDQPLRWKARWWDSYTGLYDVRARQWSPLIGSFTSIDEFVYHDRKGTLWTWPGMNPIRWRDPWGRDYESTGWEGAFLHNADMAMGMVVITTLTVMTGGLAAEVGLTGYGAAALLGGAAGWSFEGLRQMLAHEDTSVSRLVAAGGWGAVDGVMLELLLFGPSDQPRSCPVRRPTEVNLPKINAAKQGKHIVGHKNFIPGRGELTHPDPQGLLERGAGTGVPYGTKEVVDFGEIIGMYRDGAGNTSPTTRGTIHYDSQGGAHIVPARPQ